MAALSQSIKRKLSLLQLAEELKIVSRSDLPRLLELIVT